MENKKQKTRYFQEILDIKEFYNIAFSNGNPSVMLKEVFKLLKDKEIVVPLLGMIEHLLWLEMKKSEDKIYQNIIAQIKDFPKLYSLLDGKQLEPPNIQS